VIILEGVVYVVEVRIVYQNVLENLGRRSHLRDQDVGISIILKLIFEVWDID